MSKIKLSNIKNGIAKIFKFGPFIPLSNLLISFGQKRFSPEFLKKIQTKRDALIESKIRKSIGSISIERPSNPQTLQPSNPLTPQKIWILWLQGESSLPPIPKLCLESIRKNSNGLEVVFLDKDNLSQYYELPERIKHLHSKGRISNAQLSDIIRAGLLAKHGGIWMDSTILLTSPLPTDWMEKELYTLKQKPFGYFVSECKWSGFCFKMDNRNLLPHLLSAYLLKYWEKNDRLIDYFLIDYCIDIILKDNPEIKKQIDEIPLNNPEIYTMKSILDKDFNKEEYDKLTKDTSIFKLNWRAFPPSFNFSPSSYFHHLS